MSSKQRMTELRITRNGTGRTRSLCGGTVIGDYVDPQTGERVLTVKVVSVAKAPVKKASKPKTRGDSGVPPMLTAEVEDGA